MVPSVAKRGSSFKGAGAYYLHDKGKETSERVAWTRTHNLGGIEDAQRGLDRMAFTAMAAEDIKARNGTSRAGAKSKGKPVYAYSLAWHKGDNPSREEMEKAAFSSLEKLGLKDHEAVIVAHNDQDHPHIHVIANLVHPQTGKTKSMSLDFNHFSKWAQEHDREHGRNHCPERLKNNAARYKDKSKAQFVKHNDPKHERAAMFQAIHDKAKTGQELRKHLEDAGYTLAQGRKGRILVVDDRGDTINLTRQLKHKDGRGYRVKDLRERLKGIDFKTLPEGKTISEERKLIDRDAYNTEQNDKMLDAAMKHAKAQELAEKKKEKQREEKERREQKERRAKIRQYERHKETKKHKQPHELDKGGQTTHEFNKEVKDEKAATRKRTPSFERQKQKEAEEKLMAEILWKKKRGEKLNEHEKRLVLNLEDFNKKAANDDKSYYERLMEKYKEKTNDQGRTKEDKGQETGNTKTFNEKAAANDNKPETEAEFIARMIAHRVNKNRSKGKDKGKDATYDAD